MSTIKEVLHEKRKTTEDHIKQLQHEGKQGIRYTAMMPDALEEKTGCFNQLRRRQNGISKIQGVYM